ncbi:electron transfer flavoprotein subunit alpha/FixB family protein [Actinomycetaceae bacterium MB13-C1-2]|nr:electron transfer flavoprotein subunit alpha/FixB family protein [Actinomycetaceae bacterium MB13-C1-2]
MSNKLTSALLVQVDHEPDGSLAAASGKLLALASTLTDGPVVVLSFVESDVAELAALGADRVFVGRAEGFSPRVPGGVADALASAVTSLGADLGAVLLSSTYLGRGAGAMFAARQGIGAAVDIASVEVEEGILTGRKSALAGTWITTVAADEGTPVLAVRPGVGPQDDAKVMAGGATKAEPLSFELSRGSAAVRVVSSQKQPAGARVPLGDADVAVVAGRGIDGDVSLVEHLADALGAAIGATRVVCDEGWLPRSTQIGQTGVSIAPKLYLGLGVSGAVHHTCGMLASEKIVAVVDDPDAPILEIADFAVVGDLNEVVPQALEALNL